MKSTRKINFSGFYINHLNYLLCGVFFAETTTGESFVLFAIYLKGFEIKQQKKRTFAPQLLDVNIS